MKTLQVCSYYTDSKLYKNLFNALKKREIESDVFYFCNEEADRSNMDKDIIISQPYKAWQRFLYFVKHKKVYKDLLEKIDIKDYERSHAHSLMSNGYISYRLHKEFGLKYIVAVRRTDLFFFMKYKPYLKSLGASIIKDAERVVFLSPVHREKAIEIFSTYIAEDEFRKKSLVIPNGIDEIYHQQIAEPKEIKDNKINLVFIGKLADKNKNVDTIIKVVDKMKNDGWEIRLKLIGDSTEEFDKKIIAKRYIDSLGRLTPQEIIHTLKEDNIFIMPSFTETFGLVYVEAMSQGLPVIYTKGQGFEGQFEEGRVGLAVDPNSIEDIESAIKKIIDDYEGMSQRAIEGSKRYKWDDIAGVYEEIYKETK